MCILSTPAHITHDAVGCTRGIELRLIYQALAESRRATPSAQTHAPASARRGTRPRTPARRASPRRGARAAPRGRSRQCSPSSARHRGARAGRRSRPPRLRPLGRHARARGGLSAQAQCARLLFARKGAGQCSSSSSRVSTSRSSRSCPSALSSSASSVLAVF